MACLQSPFFGARLSIGVCCTGSFFLIAAFSALFCIGDRLNSSNANDGEEMNKYLILDHSLAS
jgi:hypothetical protein